jgi:hypothetical protein
MRNAHFPVLRIRDVYPIQIFFHPGSRILDPRSRTKKEEGEIGLLYYVFTKLKQKIIVFLNGTDLFEPIDKELKPNKLY